MNQPLSLRAIGRLQVGLTFVGGGLLLINLMSLFRGSGVYPLLGLGLTVWYLVSVYAQRWGQAATSGLLAVAVSWWAFVFARWVLTEMPLPFF